MDQPTSQGPGFGRRLVRAFRNLVVAALVFSSLGAALYAVSMLNARTFSLEIHEGQLVVMKGRQMPWGVEPWKPTDAATVDAYAPLALEGNMPVGVTQMKFQDREELNRALFSVMQMIAKPRVTSEAPKDLERGLYFVHRAEKLTGLTDDQQVSLKHLQSDVAFFLARTKLEDAQRQVDEALSQLRLASGVDARHSREANQMLLTVEPAAKAFDESLRKAVHELSAPEKKVEAPTIPAPAIPEAVVPATP